ncbi:MAG TPA: ASCH domain-containing protein [Acidobacteriaceae bacterium]|nr:ASCH domain-containing protein [Acidobacteriaceae bacterium]
MPPITHAISIRQPYVELILRGDKKNEFRSRLTNIRGRVYLYAALRPKDDAAAWKKIGSLSKTLPVGKIVGSVEIVGCKQRASGEFAYRLANPKRVRTPLRPLNQPQPGFWIPQF